ncbi:MAG: cobalamin B12-binding domain-containing protein, partial [Elusimicrobia bacterium]|nr:cobalamin B12-binding domain-containing protein [Elusimicrobiota bacterium]
MGRPFVFQPLGLLYVAAVLEKDYPVEIVDATLEGWRELREIDGKYYLGLPFEKLKQRIENIKPDIVGISVPFSVNEFSALKVASIVKEIDKNIITILGGHHPSVRPIETLSF